MKLIVSAGAAFTANGAIYKPGEEIPERVFSDKNILAKAIADGRIFEMGLSVSEIEKMKIEAFAAGKKATEEALADADKKAKAKITEEASEKKRNKK